jgi:feruloyl esterase
MTQIDASSNDITNLYPNFGIGSELQMPSSFGANNTPSRYGTDYAKYYLFDDPSWDWTTEFNYSTWVEADRLNPGDVNALNFNMSEFYSRGGKVLTYHGYADGLIPTGVSPLLYDNVQLAMAADGANMDDFYRLFMVPGMQHCQGSVYDAPWYFGGSGHTEALTGLDELGKLPHGHSARDGHYNALFALMDWVERKKPVDVLIATKWRNDSVDNEIIRQRPLCKWPEQAVYKGRGDVNQACNWKCSG